MNFCFNKKDFIERHIDPNKFAVIDSKREITWLQFESEVNNICLFFKQNHWDGFSKPVILYGHKQAEMITTIYAMMKLKIAYIPLDIIYPKQRILTIQRVAGAEIVLNCTTEPLNIENTTEVLVKPNGLFIVKQNLVSINERTSDSDPLVYIIFTSGSTGEPKGVQITTNAVRSFTRWMMNDFGFSSKDVFINIAIFSFDLSVYEVMSFGALGATLLLNDKIATDNSDILMTRIEKYQGTIWVSTPSFALTYARIGADKRLNSVKYFLFCGEILPHATAKTFKKEFSSAVIYNTYGPTEATVATTIIEITNNILETYNPLPIGFPKPECEILIEKESTEEKEGELIIVGDHVSIGYMNNEELNNQKFFIHQGKRAFRTGDLAYYENGILFCKGRNDDQIKMHGYRIELNEITNIICKNDLISDAVTVGLKRNNQVKKIVSFVIPKNIIGKEELNKQLIPFLEKTLPYYMIPGDIDIIECFPFNSSHKIDKIKLIDEYLKRQFNEI
jgi:D-alanine--poly(phosphoribitol) ligase subunit 1